MPQTWDRQGNLVQPTSQGMPPIMPGSAAANPNAPAIMPPPMAKPKPKMAWDKNGKPVQAGQAAPPSIEKTHPFGSGVATGGMFDAEKIGQQKTTLGSMKEVGKEMGSGALDFAKSIAMDPLNVAKPIDQMVKIQKDAYREVHDGLMNGDHDKTMHGLGLAVGHLSMLLGGAKSAKEGFGVSSTGRDAVFAAKDLTAKRAIVSAASHGALDALKDEHSAALNTAVKAEHARIGGNVQAINIADEARDPKGFKPTMDVSTKLNDSITAKKASVMLKEGKLPKTSQLKSLIAGHGPNLTFNDIKYIRTTAEGLLRKAEGVDYAILSENVKYLTSEAASRAKSLGKMQEWEAFNDASRKLGKHTEGLIPELQGSKTGLDYAKKIASEQNQGRLNTLAKDLHMPPDIFSNAVKSHKAIINFAKMTEGDSVTARMANRLIALKQHPIAASLGGATGVIAGKALGNAMGSPMAGSFIGLTLGAAFAHDLLSKYDAAQAIREIGGPSGVMGVRQAAPGTGQTPPPAGQGPGQPPGAPSGTGPSNGPGGGGSPSPNAPPVSTPPASPPSPSAPVEAAKAVPEAQKATSEAPKAAEQVDRRDHLQRPVYNLMRQARIDELRKIMKDARKPGGDILEYAKAQAMLADLLKHPEEAKDAPLPSIEDMKRGGKPEKTMTREEAQAASDKRHEPQVTKAAPEAHGRTESVRKGMTKDTPEARKAKAAERIASRRKSGDLATESSGGDVVSKAEAMKKPGGKITTGGVEDISMLESRLAELYPQLGGAKFVAKFKNVLKSTYGKEAIENGDIYKGYLQDTIEKKMAEDAKHTALESQIPGLAKEPTKVEPVKATSKPAKINHAMVREEAYKPGSIVKSYYGYDKVIEYKKGEGETPWEVKVIAVNKDGSPIPGERVRMHRTEPESVDKRAAIERLKKIE